MRRRTHYELLGVSPHASHDEIRRAYHRQARLNHPDAHPGADADAAGRARQRMVEINAAWEVLRDAEKRRAYDRAIGTTPRPVERFAFEEREDGVEDVEDWADVTVPQRPADLLVVVPVLLLVAVILTFAFSAMSQSNGLRTASLLLAPVTAGSFVAAPLFAMLRARSRRR